jgi:hypothetical protein
MLAHVPEAAVIVATKATRAFVSIVKSRGYKYCAKVAFVSLYFVAMVTITNLETF